MSNQTRNKSLRNTFCVGLICSIRHWSGSTPEQILNFSLLNSGREVQQDELYAHATNSVCVGGKLKQPNGFINSADGHREIENPIVRKRNAHHLLITRNTHTAIHTQTTKSQHTTRIALADNGTTSNDKPESHLISHSTPRDPRHLTWSVCHCVCVLAHRVGFLCKAFPSLPLTWGCFPVERQVIFDKQITTNPNNSKNN